LIIQSLQQEIDRIAKRIVYPRCGDLERDLAKQDLAAWVVEVLVSCSALGLVDEAKLRSIRDQRGVELLMDECRNGLAMLAEQLAGVPTTIEQLETVLAEDRT
jgi:hypothetical protein